MLKSLGARHKVRLAVDFHQHGDFSTGVDVTADQSFSGLARGFLGGRRLSLFAQNRDGFLDVAFGFYQCRAAIVESRIGAVPQFLYELRWNFHGCLRCTHPFYIKVCKYKPRTPFYLFRNLALYHCLQNGPLQVASERAWLLLNP